MPDFEFLQNPLSKRWVILAPRRAKRPDEARGTASACPFCPGREGEEQEVYRVSSSVISNDNEKSQLVQKDLSTSSRDDKLTYDQKTSSWLVRVIPNKFPFADIHEIIINSPDHHKSFDSLSTTQVELIFKTYRARYNIHKDKGQVYIFHNHGDRGGESLPHPHTQLAVIPNEINREIPLLDFSEVQPKNVETDNFYLFCPRTSQWPDEVWIAPKKRGRLFGDIENEEVSDLARIINTLIVIFDLRHGHEFPYNFYIYPGGDWYLRLIPRVKTLGGFEIGTGIYVNTQDPVETMEFLKEHFREPDYEKIRLHHQAEYRKHV